MGFDKSYRNSAEQRKEQPVKKSSLADELFSSGEKPKHEATSHHESRAYERNTSFTNASESNDPDNFSFGTYVPSAVTPRMNSASKRNVKFVDDLFNSNTAPTERPKTSPAPAASQAQNTPTAAINNSKLSDNNNVNPLTRSLPTSIANASKSNYDWLGLSTDDATKTNKSNENDFDDWLKPKPRNVPPVAQQQQQSQTVPPQSQLNQQTSSKPNDWLGLRDSQNSSFEREHGFDNNSDFEVKIKPVAIRSDSVPANQRLNTSFEGSNADKDEAKHHNPAFLKPPTPVKGVLNSSFADSVDNNHNVSNTNVNLNTNQNFNSNANNNEFLFSNVITSTLVQPPSSQQKEFNFNQIKNAESASESGSDMGDAWLHNLMNSKRLAQKDQPKQNEIRMVCVKYWNLL